MDPKIQKQALRRLKILDGQVRGLQKMVEEKKYCVDIITQSLAVKEALSGVESLVLKNHLATHVAQQMRGGKKDTAVKELLDIYKLSRKK